MNSSHLNTIRDEELLFINHAKNVCLKNGVRLTQLRRQILHLLHQSETPLGAYIIMDLLKEISGRKQVAPPTVYRSLEFLIEQGLIHKIHSQNSYVACRSQHGGHGEILFICNECGKVEEIQSSPIQQALNLSASQRKFQMKNQMLEVSGLCYACKNSSNSKSK